MTLIKNPDLDEAYRMANFLKEAEIRCKKNGKIEMAMMWKSHRILILEKIYKEWKSHRILILEKIYKEESLLHYEKEGFYDRK
jgi:hypothetical protein